MNENNLYEWSIYLKKNGSVTVFRSGADGTADGGKLNDDEADRFKRFVFGDNYEEEIAKL